MLLDCARTQSTNTSSYHTLDLPRILRETQKRGQDPVCLHIFASCAEKGGGYYERRAGTCFGQVHQLLYEAGTCFGQGTADQHRPDLESQAVTDGEDKGKLIFGGMIDSILPLISNSHRNHTRFGETCGLCELRS